MDKRYVSEFTEFINRYLKEHPEVAEDQRLGWDIYWNPKIDLAALNEAPEECVPDDSYGFSWLAWQRESTLHHGSERGRRISR